MPITILRPKAPTLVSLHNQRLRALQHTFRRDWDYATHHVARRRMPITITRPKQPRWPLPHALRYAYLQDTYRRPWDYLARRYARFPIISTAQVITAVCDDLIEPNDILVNEELILVASDVGAGGHGAGGYITDPTCIVRRY